MKGKKEKSIDYQSGFKNHSERANFSFWLRLLLLKTTMKMGMANEKRERARAVVGEDGRSMNMVLLLRLFLLCAQPM
jgi:hypothetical protein